MRVIGKSSKPTLPLFITEWSTSFSSRDPVHDSYISAAYILAQLKHLPAGVAGMSYWTFSDQFEENGPTPSPFHGGFGLLNAQGLPKPAFYAYHFLNQLDSRELVCSDPNAILMAPTAGGIRALFWNYTPPRQDAANQVYFTRNLPAARSDPVEVRVQHLS